MSVAVAVRLHPGDDLRVALESITRERGLTAGCVATCVGSVSKASIRFADQPRPDALEGPFEIVSLVGTLSPDGAHLHVALSDAKDVVIGGHLAEGTIVHTTAEVVILDLPELSFSRAADPATGYRELVVR